MDSPIAILEMHRNIKSKMIVYEKLMIRVPIRRLESVYKHYKILHDLYCEIWKSLLNGSYAITENPIVKRYIKSERLCLNLKLEIVQCTFAEKKKEVIKIKKTKHNLRKRYRALASKTMIRCTKKPESETMVKENITKLQIIKYLLFVV